MTEGIIIHVRQFIDCFVIGVFFGLGYEIFRLQRIAVKTHKIIIAAEDIIYFFLCAVIVFTYSLGIADGYIRLFYVIGTFTGWVIYYFTLGKLIFISSNLIINFIKKLLHLLFSILILPIILLYKQIIRFFTFIFEQFHKKIINNFKFFYIRLQNKRKLVYNYSKYSYNKNLSLEEFKLLEDFLNDGSYKKKDKKK